VESSIRLPESRISRSKCCSAMQAYIDPFHSDFMIEQHTLKVTGQRGCCNAIGCYRSLGFTREGNAQASALQHRHLWLMVHVCQQEVDSCASCPAAAARSPTHPTAERLPRRTSAFNTLLSTSSRAVYYCRMYTVQSSGLTDNAQNVRV
jgi:hypothetical protein